MEVKILIFGENGISKNSFHKCKHPVGIDKVDIDRIVISNKDSNVKKVHLNILLDT